MILYHGCSIESALQISKSGFKPNKKYNWNVKSSKGFIFLSTAYAPFFAAMAKSKNEKERALIKCSVSKINLFPDDDFVMYCAKKPVYTQKELNRISLFDYKNLAEASLKFLGNACALPHAIKIIGIVPFNIEKLLYVCDPTITPINFKIMGDYYKELTEWLYKRNPSETFKNDFFKSQEKNIICKQN